MSRVLGVESFPLSSLSLWCPSLSWLVSLLSLVPDQGSALPSIFRCGHLSVSCEESVLAVFSSFSGLLTLMWLLLRCICGRR